MVGILIVTHGELGLQFINTARLIGLESEEGVAALSIDPTQSPDIIRQQLADSIDRVRKKNGVLILTDLFGGTPANISLSFLEDGKVDVVTGINLPMIIKAINSRSDHDLNTLAKLVTEAGKENIYRASETLKHRQKRKAGGVTPSRPGYDAG